MKVMDIVTESMTFASAKVITQPDGRKAISHVGERGEIECHICDGDGQAKWGGDGEHECGYCDGKGTVEGFTGTGPEINVANSNGYEIQRMLELDPEEYGHIENKDLPAIMKQLIKLKNGDTSSHTRDSSTEQGKMRNMGNDRIGRGATMVDGGRSQSQVTRYVDQLMKVVQYAQKNNYDISWG